MPTCRKCKGHFKVKAFIDGQWKNLQSRKYCLECSPWGQHNTRKLEEEDRLDPETDHEKKKTKFWRWQRKARVERKLKLVDLLGGKCRICGYASRVPGAYHFHHVNPEDKLFGVGKNGILKKWETTLKEVVKCVLLCATCHAEVHFGLHKDKQSAWKIEIEAKDGTSNVMAEQ